MNIDKYKKEIKVIEEEIEEVKGAQAGLGVATVIFFFLFTPIALILFIFMCVNWSKIGKKKRDIEHLEREIRLNK